MPQKRVFTHSVLLLTVVTACSAPSSPNVNSSPADPIHESSEPVDEGSLVVPEDIDVDLVMRYVGLDWSSENIESELAEEKDLHLQREDMILQCMRDNGFAYTQQPFDDILVQLTSGEHGEIGSRTWHQWYGKGISTMYWPQELLPEDLIGYPTDTFLESSPSFESDLATLAPEERQAYLLAYYGDQDTQGCNSEAWDQVASEFELVVRSWSKLLSELGTRVLASEPMVSYETRIIECVKEAGHDDFAGSIKLIDEIEAQLSMLFSGIGDGMVLPDEVVDSLRHIQQRERDIAVAEFDCRLPQDEEIALFRNAVETVLDELRQDP